MKRLQQGLRKEISVGDRINAPSDKINGLAISFFPQISFLIDTCLLTVLLLSDWDQKLIWNVFVDFAGSFYYSCHNVINAMRSSKLPVKPHIFLLCLACVRPREKTQLHNKQSSLVFLEQYLLFKFHFRGFKLFHFFIVRQLSFMSVTSSITTKMPQTCI